MQNTKYYTNGQSITIYQNHEGEHALFYLRICAVETKLFPHGVVLGSPCNDKESADYWRTLFEESLGLIEKED